MRIHLALLCFALACAITLNAAEQKSTVPSSRQPGAARAEVSRTAVLNEDQVQEIRDDVNKMRSLLQQMQMNLAYVNNTQTPLKHQFELEIDMWQLVLDQMEKRIKAATAR